MSHPSSPNGPRERRAIWLIVGLVAGLCVSYFWPHEPVAAVTNDRAASYAMCTVPVSLVNTTDGVFILDFLTSELKGAVLNPNNGQFEHFYYRNVSEDFGLDPTQTSTQDSLPTFTIVAGSCTLSSRGRQPLAAGVLYVSELRSGKVVAYALPYSQSGELHKESLIKIQEFQFRQPSFD